MLRKVCFFGGSVLAGFALTQLYQFALTLDPLDLYLRYLLYGEPFFKKISGMMTSFLYELQSFDLNAFLYGLHGVGEAPKNPP